jgi:hypothetical protein
MADQLEDRFDTFLFMQHQTKEDCDVTTNHGTSTNKEDCKYGKSEFVTRGPSKLANQFNIIIKPLAAHTINLKKNTQFVHATDLA